MKEKPKYWVSLITGNKYLYEDYSNHGWGGVKHGWNDLPDEYPYTIEYEEMSRVTEIKNEDTWK